MDKKGARPHACPATRPRGAGRPSARGPAAPGGAFPPLPSSAPSCMDFCVPAPLWTPAPPRACLSPSWPPRFLGSAPGRLCPGSLAGARGLSWPLSSLSPSTVPLGPRRRARRGMPRGVCAAGGPLPAHFRTWLSLVAVPCAPSRPSVPLSTSPRPLPSLPPQPPGLRASHALGISCPCSFVRGGPGSVTCAALYGAVCKNKPIGILSVSVPSRSRRPGPAPLLGPVQAEGGRVGWAVQVGSCLPPTPGPFDTPLLFSSSLGRVPTWTGRERPPSARWTASGVAGPSPLNRSAPPSPAAGEELLRPRKC